MFTVKTPGTRMRTTFYASVDRVGYMGQTVGKGANLDLLAYGHHRSTGHG